VPLGFPTVSPFILGEVSRVLNYPRLQSRWNLAPQRIQAHVNYLAAASEIVDAPGVVRVVPNYPDDDFIVHAAIVGGAGVLCTRDSGLLIPEVEEYCLRHGVRLMNDVALYHILTGRPPASPA
jgi:predicted nucleic acid-binding protein